jgi:hypothetical protein
VPLMSRRSAAASIRTAHARPFVLMRSSSSWSMWAVLGKPQNAKDYPVTRGRTGTHCESSDAGPHVRSLESLLTTKDPQL